MAKQIAVIGSDFGGLGAAGRLAAHGLQVEVFEKRSKPGGRVISARSTDSNSVPGQPSSPPINI